MPWGEDGGVEQGDEWEEKVYVLWVAHDIEEFSPLYYIRELAIVQTKVPK